MVTFFSLLNLNAHANSLPVGILKGSNNIPKLTVWPPEVFLVIISRRKNSRRKTCGEISLFYIYPTGGFPFKDHPKALLLASLVQTTSTFHL